MQLEDINIEELEKEYKNFIKNDLTKVPSDLLSYLRKINKIPLLTEEQIKRLAEEKQEARNILIEKQCEVKLRKIKCISREDAIKLPIDSDRANFLTKDVLKVVKKGEQAQEKLVDSNLRIVPIVAMRYKDYGLDLLEIIHVGNEGLVRGVEKFDYTKRNKLSDFVILWIRQAISCALAEQEEPIKVSINMFEKMLKVINIQNKLITKLGYEPSISQIAKAMNMSEEEVEEVKKYIQADLNSKKSNGIVIDEVKNEIKFFKDNEIETCPVCGNIIVVKKTFRPTAIWGYKDLDYRARDMFGYKGMLYSDIKSCDKCGFVSTDLYKKTKIKRDFLNSDEYKSCDNIDFKSNFSKLYYREYLICLKENRKIDAFWSLLHCIWVTDDARNKKSSLLLRKKCIDLFDNLKLRKSSFQWNLIKIDLLRRTKQFKECKKFIRELKKDKELIENIYKYAKKTVFSSDLCREVSEKSIDKIITYQVELCNTEDDKRYNIGEILNHTK